jgi:polyisoprenoid-binding protein YceI
VLAPFILAAILTQPAAFRVDAAAAEAGFDLKATMHTVHGVTKGVTGEIRAEPGQDGTLKLTGRIEINAGSLATGNDRRDATMHGKTLLVSSFPSIVFEPERFVPSGPASDGGTLGGTLSGRLTIRGQVLRQSMSASLTPLGPRISVSGTFDVAWADFGIPDPSFFVVRIEPTVHAHFRADFVPIP